jgi:putative ABC transport system substrate-binding protein
MTTRRDLLIGFGATLLAGPLSALAQQQSKPWRIGFFYFGSRQSTIETGRYAAFLQGMREVGYIEEKHFVVEARYADGDAERFPAVAAELVRSKVDVIVSTAIPMHRVMQKATSTIPIVITVSFDPVKEGLARSLAHPGGNITGLTSSNAELSRKYLEVLSDTMPSLSRIHIRRHRALSPQCSHHPRRRSVHRARSAARGIGSQAQVADDVRNQ